MKIFVAHKKALVLIFLHILVLSLLCLQFIRFSDEITTFKNQFREKDAYADRRTNIDFSSFPIFEAAPDAWYQNAGLIYHAGGGIDGLDYTNSREAVEQTISLGRRYLEIDFSFTSDNQLVCVHDWSREYGYSTPPEYSSYIHSKVYGVYTPLSASNIIDYMRTYPDLYIVVDSKSGDYLSVIQSLIDLCHAAPDIADRFIIQLYREGQKKDILEIYPFSDENFLFTCYMFGSEFSNKIMDICYDENIWIITVPYGDWTDETVNFFRSKGFVIFEHTVNRPDYAAAEKERGIQGLYTDFLSDY